MQRVLGPRVNVAGMLERVASMGPAESTEPAESVDSKERGEEGREGAEGPPKVPAVHEEPVVAAPGGSGIGSFMSL